MSAELSVQRMPAGIVGETLAPVERTVGPDEPPPLPANAELAVIGRCVPRLDALEKVTGRARYTFDVQLPGMLYARCAVSTVPHARIKSIDTSRAASYPGVRAVHIMERVLGIAQLRDSAETAERFPRVRYLGQPIAAVAAVTARAAEAAAQLIRIEYERLPHVVTLEQAMQPDAPRVFDGPTEQPATAGGGGAPAGLEQHGNLRGPNRGNPRGDVEHGLATADLIIEHEFRTQVQTHVPMETHGLVADWRAEYLTLAASTHWVLSVRDDAAQVFHLPTSSIRASSDFTGGGDGDKNGIGNYGLMAIH
jgi:xanthine dehydrogenase YagR molybdenum-binding subunit